MKIGILGAGTMGSALAARFAKANHEVLLGARDPGSKPPIPGVRYGSYGDAAVFGDMVFLALVWPHALDVMGQLNCISDKVFVDVSNPEAPVGYELMIGHKTSGAEELARFAKGAHVLKAFSHFYAELLHCDVTFDGGSPSVLYCGDDLKAKELLRQLIESCGFDPVDAGGLANARYLEPLAMLTVQLVRVEGWGPTGIAWRLMRRCVNPGEQSANAD